MPILQLYRKYKEPSGLARAVSNNRNGFTVVELLVATAVFVIVVTAIVQLLFMFLRGPLQQIRQKQLEEQLTYATSEISHYIRQSKIDYTSVTGAPPYTALNLTLADQTSVSFALSDSAITFTQAGTTANLTGSKVEIQSLQFYIYPGTDPTTTTPGVAATNNQPGIVTIITARRTDAPNITAQFQTLTTSRYYAR